ncbi:MAG: outer membrane lipoprotein carrier protein LolA [Pseudomonadota bacterium]|uniref:outer membrane lipoprotein carrier protein LolA n=1 Tax=Gallaecimonas pentaromativorans TaxID=584787 RepID=UPI00067E8D71|nr:outer membrane lipoprotein carrier protein LolA [Gallaecimonas pentaromativorans]MED5525557.1 outer membrane lipoprotein carrier protein LolA [Pseudomonadota bacterium]
MALLSALALGAALATPAPCGTFSQEKSLAGLAKPFVSEGRYQLKDGELSWHTLKPFESTLQISKAGLYQQLPGQARQQIASGDNPLAASLAELLGAVVRGDTAALKAHFSVEGEGAQQTLVPKDALLQKAISRIVIDGEPPTAIRLDEPQGGQTLITLQPGQCQ